MVMIFGLILHQITAMWDVRFAYHRREVTPIEQHVHSVLEMLPVTALLIIISLHWQQFLALFGAGTELADFMLRLKEPPLPWLYVTVTLTLVLLFEVVPYAKELVRTLRFRRTK